MKELLFKAIDALKEGKYSEWAHENHNNKDFREVSDIVDRFDGVITRQKRVSYQAGEKDMLSEIANLRGYDLKKQA